MAKYPRILPCLKYSKIVILGFVISLTGAPAPGPPLVATINASIAGDWMTGVKVSPGSPYGRDWSAYIVRLLLVSTGVSKAA
jgi:threonine/homoserine/homoserine lactone efflux protein